MIVTACNIFDKAKDLLPHYFNHYSNMGINKFFFGIYGEENSHLWDEVRKFGSGLDISIYKMESIDGFVTKDAEFKTKIGKSFDGWIIPTDLDEFHTVQGYATFQQLQQKCEEENVDYISSTFVDHIRQDNTIPRNIEENISIWKQFPKTALITQNILEGCCKKICMVKSGIELFAGHHILNPNYKKLSIEAETHHFKWWGNLKEREQKKLNIYTKYGLLWKTENEKLINYLNISGSFF